MGAVWQVAVIAAATAAADRMFWTANAPLLGRLMTAAANSAGPEGFAGRYSALFQTAWGAANILAPAVCTGLLAAGYEVLWIGLSVLTLLTLPLLRYAAHGLPAPSLRT